MLRLCLLIVDSGKDIQWPDKRNAESACKVLPAGEIQPRFSRDSVTSPQSLFCPETTCDWPGCRTVSLDSWTRDL